MTFDKWYKRLTRRKSDKSDLCIYMRLAWDTAVAHCKEQVESCRNLTPGVDGGLSEADLHDWRCAVEEVVNVAQARIDRPDQPQEKA